MPCDRSLAFNASVAGSWTSACVSVNRPNSYAIYYTFSINTQTSLEINLEASGVDSFMFLMNGQGRNGSVIASDDDSGGSRNARISTMLNPGTYTIEATTYEPRTTGAFGISIAIRTPPVVVPPVVTPPTGGLDPCLAQIDINGSISSSWTSTCSSTGRSGHFAKYYVFTLQTSRAIQVDLRSTTDPFLILRTGTGRTGNIIAQNDDADGLNSRINTTLGPGTYVIEATTFAPSATGGFTVSLR